MAKIITKEEAGKALGINKTTPTLSGGESTLDKITKALTILDKPIVNKYLDRMLNKIPVLREEKPENVVQTLTPEQIKKKDLGKTEQPKQNFPKGAEILEFFQGSMAQLAKENPEMTVGELVEWLNQNKTRLAKVIDFAVISGIFTE